MSQRADRGADQAHDYSKEFTTLYDENSGGSSPVGRGTHYSVLGAEYELNGTALNFKFSVVWDEDHDERIISVIQKLYESRNLHHYLMIGERKGHVTGVLKPRETVNIASRDIELKKAIDDGIEGDVWSGKVYACDGVPDCSLIQGSYKSYIYDLATRVLWTNAHRVRTSTEYQEQMIAMEDLKSKFQGITTETIFTMIGNDLAEFRLAVIVFRNLIYAPEMHSGRTALFLAVCAGKIEEAKVLLEAGADPEIQEDSGCNGFGNGPLHQAAFNLDYNMIKLLLSHGAKIKALNAKGQTPLVVLENSRALAEMRDLLKPSPASHAFSTDGGGSVSSTSILRRGSGRSSVSSGEVAAKTPGATNK